MTYLEKCLQLAEEYTAKKQHYTDVANNGNRSTADVAAAQHDMEEAREKYIAFVDRMTAVKLHDEVTLLS